MQTGKVWSYKKCSALRAKAMAKTCKERQRNAVTCCTEKNHQRRSRRDAQQDGQKTTAGDHPAVDQTGTLAQTTSDLSNLATRRILGTKCHVLERNVRLRHYHNLDLVLVLDSNQILSLAIVQVIAHAIMNFNHNPGNLLVSSCRHHQSHHFN